MTKTMSYKIKKIAEALSLNGKYFELYLDTRCCNERVISHVNQDKFSVEERGRVLDKMREYRKCEEIMKEDPLVFQVYKSISIDLLYNILGNLREEERKFWNKTQEYIHAINGYKIGLGIAGKSCSFKYYEESEASDAMIRVEEIEHCKSVVNLLHTKAKLHVNYPRLKAEASEP